MNANAPLTSKTSAKSYFLSRNFRYILAPLIVLVAGNVGYSVAEYQAREAEYREAWLHYAVRELGGVEARCHHSRISMWRRSHLCTATLPRANVTTAVNYPYATIKKGTSTAWQSSATQKQGVAIEKTVYEGTFAQQENTALEGIQFSIYPELTSEDAEASLMITQEYNVWFGPF